MTNKIVAFFKNPLYAILDETLRSIAEWITPVTMSIAIKTSKIVSDICHDPIKNVSHVPPYDE